ncbi:hypothetical protein AAH979_32435 [Plantactinospora sp. ZYX-F-223]|uniref:hypothetical protein n=1 Tax=Plantactinospora sp. ZYX-F-223 TaxID=3144103 RepID=UPI0031FCFB5C
MLPTGCRHGAGAAVPDRLTEDFLALTIPGHGADYPAQSWATRMVSRLADLGADADEVRAATRAVTFLVAAAERWTHLPGACLNAVLERRPDLAVRAGPSTVRAVAELGEVTIDVLEAVDHVLPDRRQLGYESAAAAITDRIVTHRLPETDDPARRAALVARRGERSWYAGRDVAAAGDFAALADLVEPWAQVDPLSHSWNLAAARSNLAASRRSAGRLAEALAAARSATETRRRMAERKPSVFLPSYALFSYQLALLLIEDGHAASAWQTLTELDRFCAGVVAAFGGRQSAKLAQLLASGATRDVAARGAGAAADSFAALCRSTAQDIVDYQQNIAALFPRPGESVEQAGRRAARGVPARTAPRRSTATRRPRTWTRRRTSRSWRPCSSMSPSGSSPPAGARTRSAIRNGPWRFCGAVPTGSRTPCPCWPVRRASTGCSPRCSVSMTWR